MKKIIFILIIFSILLISCQSRFFSRYTGSELELDLPEDFGEPISFSSGRKGEKDLFYKSKDGTLRVKTYTDFGVFESEIIFKKNK